MFQNCTNSKKQGDVGLGIAIGWFAARGITVSVPLTDSQDYDLIVDECGFLKRVQVRTTSQRKKSGSYCVGLRVLGGNRSWSGVAKFFDPAKVDYLFVLTESNDRYLIPSADIKAKSEITLNEKWLKYKCDGY